jgi:threonine dehydrogenase-like Zn-dependent dehydrogenase
MTTNRGVVYVGPGKVEVKGIDYPKFFAPNGKEIDQGIPGLYVTDDPGGVDEAAKTGSLSIRLGLGWAKSHSLYTGQTPVLKYNRQLMQAILHNKVQIAKAVNVTVVRLDEAPKGYLDFDKYRKEICA